MRDTVYPDHYTNQDKAMYDDMLSRGEALIGKKLMESERFILDLSAKMTINKMKGLSNNLTQDEVDEIKAIHKENSNTLNFTTPPDIFYDGLLHLEDGSTFTHPLTVPEPEKLEHNDPYNSDVNVDI
tara:strand:- start:9848 stop:10228 length:381 start_codon:yes stop_codon:yes gene_type:complete